MEKTTVIEESNRERDMKQQRSGVTEIESSRDRENNKDKEQQIYRAIKIEKTTETERVKEIQTVCIIY